MFSLKAFFSSSRNVIIRHRQTAQEPSSTQNAAKPAGRPAWKGLTITLSVGGVLASGIGLVVLLAWVFFFGIIVGRGYNPETQMPGAALLAQTDPSAEENPEKAILKPEELTFLRDLKQIDGAATPVSPAAPVAPAAGSQGKTANGTQSVQASAAPSAENAAPRKPQPSSSSKPMLDFVLQVATYKSPEPAEALRERLEELGMRTRMVREKNSSGKSRWYRVNVLLRGTEDAAERVKAELASIGIHDAIIISRKAAD